MTAKYPKCPNNLRLSAVHCSRTGSCRYRRHQLRDALESAPKAVGGGLLLHHPVSLAGHGPVMSEAEQVEGARPGTCLTVCIERRSSPVRPSEINQPGLLRVKRQTILRQALRQYVEDSPRVPFVLKDDDNVISITNESRTTGKSRTTCDANHSSSTSCK